MTIDDLVGIIRGHGRRHGYDGFCIRCEVLEHVVDVEGFIELLRGFKGMGVSFVDDYSDPVRVILCGDVEFRVFGEWAYIVVGVRSYVHSLVSWDSDDDD